jgi:hypothetical protein
MSLSVIIASTILNFDDVTLDEEPNDQNVKLYLIIEVIFETQIKNRAIS